MTRRTDERATYPVVETIIDIIADWVKKHRYAAGLRDELARCGPEEVARAARDFGLNSSELVLLASKGPRAADQLAKLLLALGVDPKQLASENSAMMRDLKRVCIVCGHKQRCEHDLTAGTAAQRYRSYCPNASSLAALSDSK